MAGRDVFLRSGLECVDAAPPSYELLATRLRKAPRPKFRTGWDETLREHAAGLTIIRSEQCPCIPKCTEDILRACGELGIRPKVVELETGEQARRSPSGYGIFNVIHDGEVIAEHPIGGTRFLSIMRKRME